MERSIVILLVGLLLMTASIRSEGKRAEEGEVVKAKNDVIETQQREIEQLRLAVEDLKRELEKNHSVSSHKKRSSHSRRAKSHPLASLSAASQATAYQKEAFKKKYLQASVPVEKLFPSFPSADVNFNKDPIAMEAEEDTVADSSQESMHHYFSGLDGIEQKKYEEAIQSFDKFIRLSPHHVYADRAQYLIAFAASETKEHNLVLVSTNILEARYPYCLKMAEAQFLKAKALFQLDLKDKARETLQKLVNDYPRTEFAQSASKQLIALNQNTAGSPSIPKPPLMPEPDAQQD